MGYSQISDLDQYLEEPLQKREKAWWRANASIFPTVGKMARDFLSIPVSAILSKSTFGSDATNMNPAFNGLGPDIIEALICRQDWLESPEKKSMEGKPSSSLVLSSVRCESPVKQMYKYLAGPFTVSKPISPEDLKLLQYIFDTSLIGSEIVVQCKHYYYLTRRELCSLRPQTCLDDNILSTMSDALTLIEIKKEDFVNCYLPICFTMYVPVFDKERSHFYLYVLHLKMQVVEIWDSLAGSNDKRLLNLLVSLNTLFKDDIDQNYQSAWSFTDFRVERPMNVPQQPNGYDCGLYVFKFMLAPEEVTNPDFVFDSDNERLEVVLYDARSIFLLAEDAK